MDPNTFVGAAIIAAFFFAIGYLLCAIVLGASIQKEREAKDAKIKNLTVFLSLVQSVLDRRGIPVQLGTGEAVPYGDLAARLDRAIEGPYLKEGTPSPECDGAQVLEAEIIEVEESKEALAGKLIDLWCAENGGQIPWSKAVEIVAVVTNMQDDERQRLHALADDAQPDSRFHKQDSADRVRFYEQEFYVLSNFSSFQLNWMARPFPTAEHAYQWEKFNYHQPSLAAIEVARSIRTATSAHDAFKIAEANAAHQDPNWPERRLDVMRAIIRAKAGQHEYVMRKLLETGDRELVEDSWRDSFWGWGPDRAGENWLGKLWMEYRTELANAHISDPV